MQILKLRVLISRFATFSLMSLLIACLPHSACGAGVTVITHGFGGNIESWIIPMAERMPKYAGVGTNYVCYEFRVTYAANNYFVTPKKLKGPDILSTTSGHVFIKLDWSDQAGVFGSSTTKIAEVARFALLSTNLVAEMKGRPLAELPLHLIGHSRGGSLVCALARLLGERGLWVDHVTTLDPHPVPILADEDALLYENVVFADNYWQNRGDGIIEPNGQHILGAFNRYLSDLSGGYSSPHSDVHLWYHGTIDFTLPLTTDTQASIGLVERDNWFTPYELRGLRSGFYYSLIGGSNRLTDDQPDGPGTDMVNAGFNRAWDIGAGRATNRYALASNDGSWPNLIQLNLIGSDFITLTNGVGMQVGKVVFADLTGSVSTRFYYQYARSVSETAQIKLFLDPDTNPYNSNSLELTNLRASATGNLSVGSQQVSAALLDPQTARGKPYYVYAEIRAAGRTRFLYAPESLLIFPQPEISLPTRPTPASSTWTIGVKGRPGKRVALERTIDLATWTRLSVKALNGSLIGTVEFQDPNLERNGFYRAVYVP